MKLNLGSGARPLPGYVNVDIRDMPGVDVLADLEKPWPWEDGTAAEIMADNLFEHVADPVHFMTEAHRVMMRGAKLTVIVPHYLSPDAFTDPTHKRFCTPDTMSYWTPGNPYYDESNYGGIAFDALTVTMGPRGRLIFEMFKGQA